MAITITERTDGTISTLQSFDDGSQQEYIYAPVEAREAFDLYGAPCSEIRRERGKVWVMFEDEYAFYLGVDGRFVTTMSAGFPYRLTDTSLMNG